MKIHFEDSEGTAPRAASFEIPQPDTEGYAELITDHFTTLADDAGIPFQKNSDQKRRRLGLEFHDNLPGTVHEMEKAVP